LQYKFAKTKIKLYVSAIIRVNTTPFHANGKPVAAYP